MTLTKNLTMAENQPPSNARNATIDMAEGHAIERAPLRDVYGHRVSVTGSKAAEIMKLEVLLADERKSFVSIDQVLVNLVYLCHWIHPGIQCLIYSPIHLGGCLCGLCYRPFHWRSRRSKHSLRTSPQELFGFRSKGGLYFFRCH
jgi:hypothetical protein